MQVRGAIGDFVEIADFYKVEKINFDWKKILLRAACPGYLNINPNVVVNFDDNFIPLLHRCPNGTIIGAVLFSKMVPVESLRGKVSEKEFETLEECAVYGDGDLVAASWRLKHVKKFSKEEGELAWGGRM